MKDGPHWKQMIALAKGAQSGGEIIIDGLVGNVPDRVQFLYAGDAVVIGSRPAGDVGAVCLSLARPVAVVDNEGVWPA